MHSFLLASLLFLAVFLSGCGLLDADCGDTKCNAESDPECRANIVDALCAEGGASRCASDSACSCSGKTQEACREASTCCYWKVAGGCRCHGSL